MATGATGVNSTLSPGSSRRRRQSFAQLHSLKAGFHWRRRAELYKRLWPSENQKLEAWAESQVRRNRSRMNQYVSISSDSVWRLCCLWSSENYIVGVGSKSGRTNQSQGPESSAAIGLFFRFLFIYNQFTLCKILQQLKLLLSLSLLTNNKITMPFKNACNTNYVTTF